MKVLVLGAGRVGLGVSNYFYKNGIDVTIIEKNEEIFSKIRSSSNLNIICGNSVNVDVLREANAENASHVIAVTSSDEQNIVSCKIASSIFGVKNKIARVRSSAFVKDKIFELFLKENFDIDIIIQPEIDVAREVYNIAKVWGAFDTISLNEIIIIGINAPEHTEILNTPLRHIGSITNLDIFILTITRNKLTFFPRTDDMLVKHDQVYLATTYSHLKDVLKLFGYNQNERQYTLIIGGGNVGYSLLKKMTKRIDQFNVLMLEKDALRAEKIAQDFPNVTIIPGDALNYELIQEISSGINSAIVITDNDKVNVLSSLFLKQLETKRILTLANSSSYESLLPIKNGCSIINPSEITINSILHKARKGKVSSVTSLKHQLADIVEAIVTESCTHIGRSLVSLKNFGSIMPICIVRDGYPIFRAHNLTLTIGDKVILLVEKNSLKKVEKIFANYFFSNASEDENKKIEDKEIDALMEEDDNDDDLMV